MDFLISNIRKHEGTHHMMLVFEETLIEKDEMSCFKVRRMLILELERWR